MTKILSSTKINNIITDLLAFRHMVDLQLMARDDTSYLDSLQKVTYSLRECMWCLGEMKKFEQKDEQHDDLEKEARLKLLEAKCNILNAGAMTITAEIDAHLENLIAAFCLYTAHRIDAVLQNRCFETGTPAAPMLVKAVNPTHQKSVNLFIKLNAKYDSIVNSGLDETRAGDVAFDKAHDAWLNLPKREQKNISRQVVNVAGVYD